MFLYEKEKNRMIFSDYVIFSRLFSVNSQQLKNSNIQEDPCKAKNKVVGDATYCDRYWECVDGQPELYDCPNGLVYAGKNRGVTEGCDYPWRANYCEDKQLASTYGLYAAFTFSVRGERKWSSEFFSDASASSVV